MTRTFRPEIQLLRAIAVLTVVVYHLNPNWLPGGYVGVDVFFVISGYLITAHMLRELESTGTLSLTQFWAARIRRILPAALVTIAVTALAAIVLLPLTQLKPLATQALASVFYVQNFVLARESVDYLAEGSIPTPFQHFWSLSVEEQFYLVWPLLALGAMLLARLLHRKGARLLGGFEANTVFRWVVFAVFGILVAVSFVYSTQLVGAQDPRAYFLTAARVWELGIGGLLAVVLGDPRRFVHARKILALAGVAAIMYAAVTYGAYTPAFPGTSALIPVLGTAAVIAAGETRGFASLQPLIEFAPTQWLGNLSYSLYLWHFPVVVFYLARVGEHPKTPAAFAGLLALSLGLAVLSYRFVENPVRLNVRLKKKPRRAMVSGVTAMVLGAGVALVPQMAYAMETERLGEEAAAVAQTESTSLGSGSMEKTGAETFITADDAMTPQPADADKDVPEYPGCVRVPNEASDDWTGDCVVANPEGSKTLVVVGDSHASQWVPALEETYKNSDWKIVTLLHNACPFNFAQRDFEKYGELDCTGPNHDTQQKILDMKPDRVFIANRAVNDYHNNGSEEFAGEQGYIDAWKPLVDAGIRITVMRPTPEFGDDKVIPDCVALNMDDPNHCGISRQQGIDDQETGKAMQAAAHSLPGAEFVDMTDSFCYEDWCPVVVGSVLMYRDNTHITATYMRTLGNNLAYTLDEPALVKEGDRTD